VRFGYGCGYEDLERCDEHLVVVDENPIEVHPPVRAKRSSMTERPWMTSTAFFSPRRWAVSIHRPPGQRERHPALPVAGRCRGDLVVVPVTKPSRNELSMKFPEKNDREET
jgi:hypothetical protein